MSRTSIRAYPESWFIPKNAWELIACADAMELRVIVRRGGGWRRKTFVTVHGSRAELAALFQLLGENIGVDMDVVSQLVTDDALAALGLQPEIRASQTGGTP